MKDSNQQHKGKSKPESDQLTGELEKDIELLIKLKFYKLLDQLLEDDEKVSKVRQLFDLATANHVKPETRKKWRKAVNRNIDLSIKNK